MTHHHGEIETVAQHSGLMDVCDWREVNQRRQLSGEQQNLI